MLFIRVTGVGRRLCGSVGWRALRRLSVWVSSLFWFLMSGCGKVVSNCLLIDFLKVLCDSGVSINF